LKREEEGEGREEGEGNLSCIKDLITRNIMVASIDDTADPAAMLLMDPFDRCP